ncbi:MAG: 7-carboxy-7-deazaguanine synthase [Thermoplasmata archaeon]|nr:7-carboxy-7-deazaguanine synthase [Thermoplasmata archaeon]
MPPLRLTEIFHSLQGEGSTVGLPTTFVRLTGCSLRCSWCDTTYSFTGGQDWTVPQVLERLAPIATKRVCVTGGEPLDQYDAAMDLMETLLARGYFVVLETSGSIDVARADKLAPREMLQISLDVKCPASNMQKRNHLANLALLRPHDQLKFVLSDRRDYDFAKEILAAHPTKAQVLFQPMWPSPDPVTDTKLVGDKATLAAVADWVLADGLDVRVGTQMHKVIWGHEKGR